MACNNDILWRTGDGNGRDYWFRIFAPAQPEPWTEANLGCLPLRMESGIVEATGSAEGTSAAPTYRGVWTPAGPAA